METQACDYRFLESDFDLIESIGFSVVPKSAQNFSSLINVNYTNFNLARLLKEIDMLLIGTTDEDKVKSVTINVDLDNDLTFYYCDKKFLEDHKELALCRIFTKDSEGKILVEHAYFQLPSIFQNKGIAKKILKESLKEYVNIGVESILIYAALDGGGYSWAKCGFVATNRWEVEVILDKALRSTDITDEEKLIVQKIFNNYYSKAPLGDEFPIVKWATLTRESNGFLLPYMKLILRGTHWHGKLDLKNPDYFSIFKNYVFGGK